MADNTIGFALDIPNDVIGKITQIDEKINKIATDSEKMATAFQSAMSRMGNGAGDLLGKLQTIQNIINKLGGANAERLGDVGKSMGDAATQAAKAAVSITDVANAINKFNSYNKKSNTGTLDAERKAYVEKYKMYERMFDQIEKNEKRILEASEREKKSVEQTAKAHENAIKRQEAAQARLDSRLRRSNYSSYITSTEGALRTAEKTSTFQQRAQAIKNLETAMKRLRTTDANYSQSLFQLTEAHRRLNEQQREFRNNLDEVRKKQSNLINTSEQLKRQLALLFSVSQIKGYMMNIIKVRGEFELQNTALASILQNKEQADRLFAQVTELAVKSPFTVKELTTYTKSLSAYQVEYEKLYGTTKMLADVSAGLGVDMQRLILAFGQVKAANILRGTEVRQFTEAGLNILGELAKYYSELEGRMISVGEVQDMVTKRMVSFGDVEEVFKRVTSAGGIFYNMQERQAETLAGMMSNLQDRIDLMLNEIGKDNQETIKSIISFIGDLLENYDSIVSAIKAVGAAFILYKLNIIGARKELIRYAVQQNIVTASTTKQLTVIQLLRVGFLRLVAALKAAGIAMKTFMASNLWLIGLTAIAGAIYELVSRNNELNEQLDEINKKYNEQSASLIKVSEAYKEVTKRAKEATSAQGREDIYKEQFAQLQKLNEMLEDRGYRLPIHIELVTPNNIDEAFASGQEMLQLANDFSAEFQKALAVETNAAEGWFNVFGDNLSTDLQELSDAYGNVAGGFKANLDLIENEVINISGKLTGAAKSYYEELRAGQKDEESSTEWTLRRLDLLYKINQEVGVNLQEGRYKSMIANERTLMQLYRQRLDISNKEKEVQYELGKVVDELIKKYGSIDNLKKQFNDNPVVIRTEIDRAFEQMELDAQTKRFAAHWAANRLQIPIEFTEQSEIPTFFNDWRDTVKTLDTEKVFDKQLSSLSDISKFEDVLQKKYKENKEILETLNQTNTENLDLTRQIAEAREKLSSADANERTAAELNLNNLEKQKKVFNENITSQKEKITLQNKEMELIAKSLNLNLKSNKDSLRENNDALNKLKAQIKLIQDAGKEYEKYRKLYDEPMAQQLTEEAFTQAFKDVGLSVDMEFDVNGVIEGIRKVISTAGVEGQKIGNEAIAKLQTDANTEERTKEVEEYRKQIDELFASLSNYQELEKLGLNKDLISQLFGINVSSINDVQDVFEKIKTELKKYGDEGEKIIADVERKITQQQQNELNIRLKEYAQMLKKSISERARIELETQEKIRKVQETSQLDDVQKRTITQSIRIEADKAKAKATWKDFQNTDLYIRMFEDLDSVSTRTLNLMQNKLAELRSSLKNLDPQDLKAISEQMEKINEEAISRNPFSGMVDNIKKYIEYRKQANELEEQYEQSFNEEDRLKGSVEQQQILIGNLERQYDTALRINGAKSDEVKEASENLNEAKQHLDILLDQLVAQGKITKELANQIRTGEKLGESLGQRFSEIGSWASQASSAVTEMASSLENVFGNMGDKGGDITSTLSEVLGGVGNMASGVGRFMAGDVVGGSIQALSGLVSTIGSLFAIGDKKKEREIQRQLGLVDDLEKAYEKLGETIDEAYSIDTLERAGKQTEANLEQQKQALEEAIRLEQDKKKTDEDRIKEWEQQTEDINEQLEELAKDTFSKVTSGILDDVLSAADEFTDAWLQAFKETGDGMTGLEENFQEMLENMLKRQASMLITNTFLENWKKQLEKYINADDLELTTDEAKKWVDSVESSLPALSEALESYFKAMQDAGIDLSGEGGDTLTGLQKGIQGITEDTAEVLAAITESIRFFASDSNAVLHNIYNLILNPSVESPLMIEMQNQTRYLSNLDSLISSVVKASQGKGKVLRVEIV